MISQKIVNRLNVFMELVMAYQNYLLLLELDINLQILHHILVLIFQYMLLNIQSIYIVYIFTKLNDLYNLDINHKSMKL